MTSDFVGLIEAIEQLTYQGANVEQLVPKLHELVSVGSTSLASLCNPGTELFRATKHHRTLPHTIDELWYPPPQKTRLGRANREGQPMFYCSSDPDCAFREIEAAVGQLVVHSKWVTKGKMVLHDLGYTAQVLSRSGSRRDVPAHHQKFYRSNLDERGRKIRDFIALAFTEPSEARYALTAAIAEVHLGTGDTFSGLLYPAVSKAANVDNLALRPEFVRAALRLDEAQLVKIDNVDKDRSSAGFVLCDLVRVEGDGSLVWSFRGQSVDVPPGGSHGIRLGERATVQNQGEIQVEGKRYRVEPGYVIEASALGVCTIRDLRGDVVEPLP